MARFLWFWGRKGFMATKVEKLIEVLEPLADDNGLELVTVEIAGTKKNPILRVYLDTPEGGINLDQLAAAREWVDTAIDELDPFQGSFVLEVSSPGIDRPLRKASDYERFAGEEVVVYLKPGEAKTKETGVLVGVEDDAVVVEQGEQRQRIMLDRIKKANIVGRIDFSQGGLTKENEAE